MSAGDVYRALWRHRVFIVVMTALMAGATYFFVSRETPQYSASTLVRVQERITDPTEAIGSLDASQRLAETYAKIIGSGALDQRVRTLATSQPNGNPGSIHLSGSPVQDLDLLWITATSGSPDKAAQVANAAPPALRAFIQDTGTLRDQVVTIKPATPPTSPSSPRKTLALALALSLGLIFNCGLALLIEVLSDRLPESDELEVSLGYPVLATIPTLDFVGVEASTVWGGPGNGDGRQPPPALAEAEPTPRGRG
jgi:capsular polysaccharide biosynthesis protein